jgi:hypothetical protein
MGDLFDTLLHNLREQGVMGLVDAALPQLSITQRQSALAVASHLVHADRTVTSEESSFLDALARRVDLPKGEAATIVAAIEALNRDSLDD